jgi:hypothetical protein
MKTSIPPAGRPVAFPLLVLTFALIAAATFASSAYASSIPTVSAQGLFQTLPGKSISPRGLVTMEFALSPGPENRLLGDILVTEADPSSPSTGRVGRGPWRLHDLPGPTFFISDLGRIVTLETFDPPELPGVVRVFDLTGRLLHEEQLRVPTDPGLSPDGTRFVCRTVEGVVSLDLATFGARRYPLYSLFAAGPAGMMAGMEPEGPLEIRGPNPGSEVVSVNLPPGLHPVRLAFAADGASLFLLAPDRLLRLDPQTGADEVVYRPDPAEELRDLRLSEDSVLLGLRRLTADRCEGASVVLAQDGSMRERRQGPTMDLPRADFSLVGAPEQARAREIRTPSIPWPLQPNSEHPIGNTYNEYQYYGGSPYPHPGIDVFGDPGQHVYAVHSGVVKAILTTGGDLYWRIGIADTLGNGTLPGYLYAHLVQSSIPVTVGQHVTAGQYLGDLVDWPIAGFTHTHFARIQDTGAQWSGGWICIGNPHLYLQNQTDLLRPVFEPARGTDLLAFCGNETSTYQNPTSLHGSVDIIAHVGDRIISTYVCTVQELRYTIYPLGNPGVPIVRDKLAVYFDMTNDYYAGGSNYSLLVNILYKQDSICRTQGDYDYREYYHILTNSDEDQSWGPEDLQQCWNTSTLPDGSYVIRVTARDVAGNTTIDSMTVQTVNGNPSAVAGETAGPALFLESRPNPARGSAAIVFSLAAPDRVSLDLYDLSGRRVRSLLDAPLLPGAHTARWDGLGDSGLPLPGGVYFYRLSGRQGTQTGRLVWRR